MSRLSKILVDWRNLQNGNVLSDFQTFQISEKKDLMFFFDLETRSIKRKKIRKSTLRDARKNFWSGGKIL